MSSDPKPVGGPWHKAARGEVLSPPKGASEETLVPQLFTASVPDPRTVQTSSSFFFRATAKTGFLEKNFYLC